jgi:uncharacterized protein YbjT (DUF2867 family)
MSQNGQHQRVARALFGTSPPLCWSALPRCGRPEPGPGIADTGRVALIDDRDVADAVVSIITDQTTWGRHRDLTGPTQFNWPDAMELLSAELDQTVTFKTTTELRLIGQPIDAGVAPGQAQLLVTREWAMLAGENERTTEGVRELTGHDPRTVADFLHQNRDLFTG